MIYYVSYIVMVGITYCDATHLGRLGESRELENTRVDRMQRGAVPEHTCGCRVVSDELHAVCGGVILGWIAAGFTGCRGTARHTAAP